MGKLSRQERIERQLKAAVEQISGALIRLFEAAGGERGHDCAQHATLGQALLRDYGFETTLVVGSAAWCTGPDRAGINHVPVGREDLLPGRNGFTYHAWLQCAGRIIDFTTYQLASKARATDLINGDYTPVTWCPQFLVIAPHRTQTFDEVRRSSRPGAVHYQPRPELLAGFEGTDGLALNQKDLLFARRLLANSSLGIAGPNWIIDAQVPAREKLRLLEHLMEILGAERVPATVQRVAKHLHELPVPLTNDEVAHLDRLVARVPQMNSPRTDPGQTPMAMSDNAPPFQTPEWLASLGADMMRKAKSILLGDGQHANLVVGLRKDGGMNTVVLAGVPEEQWPLLVMEMEATTEHVWVAHICEAWYRVPDATSDALGDRREALFVEVKDEESHLYALIQIIERDAQGQPFFVAPPFCAPPAARGQVSHVLGVSEGVVPPEFK